MQKPFDDFDLTLGDTATDVTVNGHVIIEDGAITEIMVDWMPTVTATRWSLDPLERLVWAGMLEPLEAHFDAEIISTADYDPPEKMAQREFI